jgi:urease accessory protein
MLRQMGAEVTAVNMPFNPESGAYGAGGHAHHAGEGRGHRHD